MSNTTSKKKRRGYWTLVYPILRCAVMGAAASSGLGQQLVDWIVEAHPKGRVDAPALAAKMRAAFAIADSSGTGFVTRMQFQTVLLDALGCGGQAAHQAEVVKITRVFDPNDDGQINYGEFVSFFQAQAWGGSRATDSSSPMPQNDYERLMQQCQASQTLFEDPTFPADDKSLWGVTLQPPPEQTIIPVWLRPSQFAGVGKETAKPQVLFEDEPTPGDVLEGAIGDCFFIAAVR